MNHNNTVPIVRVKKLIPGAIIPSYATTGSGCFDLHAADVPGILAGVSFLRMASGCSIIIRTGLAFEIPPGHVMMIYSRSGHGFKNNVRLANCVGVIDSDYRGEVMVKLTCDHIAELSQDPSEGFIIRAGDRIAQAMIIEAPMALMHEVTELSDTARGTGGFGSTGA